MGRILAIDYGRKRCGVAVTDILKIAANGLPTVATKDILKFIKDYCAKEDVEEIVIGQPKTLRNEPSESMKYINPFLGQLRKELPDMKVTMFDERFTSSIAVSQALLASVIALVQALPASASLWISLSSLKPPEIPAIPDCLLRTLSISAAERPSFS